MASHGIAVAQILSPARILLIVVAIRTPQEPEAAVAMGVLPVVNENDAISPAELRFGTTTPCSPSWLRPSMPTS
ncbi:MAG: hypothetical protein CM15mP77_1790 [Synechococcus sp.]|nr:MAG: hypothetical protein CM15mP77_1790 [Synechococcus sp.]